MEQSLKLSVNDSLANQLCPDLTAGWRLGKLPNRDSIILQSLGGSRTYSFNAVEGYALQYFTGKFTISQVQSLCENYFGGKLNPGFIQQLLQQLVDRNVIEPLAEITAPTSEVDGPRLKSCVQWIPYPNRQWILRNPEAVTFLQVSEADRAVLLQLGRRPLTNLLADFNLSAEELQHLLQLLTATGMLTGTEPVKPPRKISLLSLLYFQVPLFNPDRWLTQHVGKVQFLFTPTASFLLLVCLAFAMAIGLAEQPRIFSTGQQLLAQYDVHLLFPFVLIMMGVISLHELGHAFTLKHYNGIVPEMGLMFICLLPGAYTDTTDSYGLVRRSQRAFVYAAGILCQLGLWAIALLLWHWSQPETGLFIGSYLLMIAAQFTLLFNLNPLSKLDGYYILVALTGLNNLRQRSLEFYRDLWRNEPSPEQPQDYGILAIYMPLSFAYSLWAIGNLLFWITQWLFPKLPL
ncbi:MAG: M50 family metallopeptidase [Leptolyngbyaceae cyanobacterium bins.59]|nr:M50 family metallopeptidase [Leptolyngbyaceae cyanobacterium bins.59]